MPGDDGVDGPPGYSGQTGMKGEKGVRGGAGPPVCTIQSVFIPIKIFLLADWSYPSCFLLTSGSKRFPRCTRARWYEGKCR